MRRRTARSRFAAQPFADDKLREECGIFGMYGHADSAAHTALGLHALQHRGQEAAGIVSLTRLYDWYADDFEQVAESVLRYAALWSPPLKRALEEGRPVKVRWLDYDWKLNDGKRPG